MEDRKTTNVNKRDFFLHVFDELMAPESKMFIYNESQTVAWFPPKVRPIMEKKPTLIIYVLLKKIKQQIKKINKKINIERYRYMINFRFKMDFSVSQFLFIHRPNSQK